MSFSLGPGAFLDEFASDRRTEALFSAEADVANMLRYEQALVRAQAAHGLVPGHDAVRIATAIDGMAVDMAALRDGFRRDGVVPPALVAQLRAAVPADSRDYLHLGATSQDLVDSSGMLACRGAVAGALDGLRELDEALVALAAEQSRRRPPARLMARTRMQVALPLSAPEKIDNWRAPLTAAIAAAPAHFPLQLGGPEGQYRAMAERHAEVSAHMAEALGLSCPERPWHTDRAPLQAIASWYARLAAVLGKLATDVLFMAQSEVAELRVSGGGHSSAMAHKLNPVLAEVVLAQARHAQALQAGLGTAAIHENERSGASWTLEWLLLPALVVAGGSLCRNARELVARLEFA